MECSKASRQVLSVFLGYLKQQENVVYIINLLHTTQRCVYNIGVWLNGGMQGCGCGIGIGLVGSEFGLES